MLSALRILFINEMHLILREKVALFWIFVFPFFFMAIMLLSSGRYGLLGDQKIVIIDHDNTALSSRYIGEVRRVFSTDPTLHATVVLLDHASGNSIDSSAVRVTLPKGFANAFSTRSGTAEIRVAYDYSGGFGSVVAARAFSVLTATFESHVGKVAPPARIVYVNTTRLRPVGYLQYMLTGILVMSMMTVAMNNTCIGIVAMRERNTFKLMSCLPLSPGMYLGAMLLARIVILLFASFALLIGGRYVYAISLPMSVPQYLCSAGLIVVGGVTLLAIGIAMASRIARVQTAMFVCNVVYLSLLFASNLTIPMSSFPAHVQRLLQILPTAQFVSALRAILVQGSSLVGQWPTLVQLLAWSLVCVVFTRLTFRWHA